MVSLIKLGSLTFPAPAAQPVSFDKQPGYETNPTAPTLRRKTKPTASPSRIPNEANDPWPSSDQTNPPRVATLGAKRTQTPAQTDAETKVATEFVTCFPPQTTSSSTKTRR